VGEHVAREWLRRRLGTFGLYALVHSDFQSTYYFLVGYIALAAGAFGFIGAVYGVLLMAAVALAYGEMGSRFPEAGGSYLYVEYSFGETAAFLSTWLLAFDQIVMVSYGTIDAAKVLEKALGLHVEAPLAAALLSTALFAITLVGIRESALFATAVAVLDISTTTTMITLSLAQNPAPPPYFNWHSVEAANLLLAFSLLSRGFTGLDSIGQLAGEAKEPLVQVPRATLAAVAMGSFYGLGLMAAIMSTLTPQEIADPAVAPLYLAAKLSPALYSLASASIFAVMMTAALAGYVSFSRLTYIMAQSGDLPHHFAKVHPRFRTPYASLVVTYAISLALIAVGEVEIILAIYAIGSLINYLLVAAALAKAAKSGTLHGAFKTPYIRGIPLSSWIGLALIPPGLALTLTEKWPYLWALALWAAAGAALYYAKKRR